MLAMFLQNALKIGFCTLATRERLSLQKQDI